MARVDVTVRGGGIFGLSVAWACLRRGARVRLVETARIGAGASGGVVGALSPFAPGRWDEVKAFQLEALEQAPAWWSEVAAVSGLATGYGRVGRLQPLADEAALAAARVAGEAAERHWGPGMWRLVPATGAAWEPASASGWLVEDRLSARLHPRLAGAALAGALQAMGGELVLGEAEDEGAVVWATGAAGLAALSADLGREVGRGVKGQAVRLAFVAGDGAPQLYAGGLHLVAHVDGTVAVGSTSETEWEGEGPDALAEGLVARAVAAVPALAGAAVAERWAGIRPRARSRAPMLGAWPGRPGHWVANGGFKIGFGVAPLVGEVMAELVLEGRDRVPAPLRVEASL
ncbi:NAD(P)/FAD-dependent oxidoreductase [Neotabrizicola shimadae]|uniref:FAD-binding oxidoreductase n=1 Tax=Neotabrizicola shimadae TaxID=2807096 RepID=A0A8G0ZX56_9RHOB|nr:FAD-binding oxidoreductase [Neotabrizicola shimadae]QYZ69669.1 FAD-binding oxidoreductase [Neotabrizicola shimadae]